MRWQHANGSFEFKDRPLLMGILNVTPDSFSDGGRFMEVDRAVEQGLKMLEEGASILDVGGESTRPGAEPVTAEKEMERVLPVIESLLKARPGTILSIDTYKSKTARQAMADGASIINDVGGLVWDEGMLQAVIDSRAGYIGMHSRGRPTVMQHNPHYENVVEEVGQFFSELKSKFISSGMEDERLVLDVGIGFGKSPGHNLELLRAHEEWSSLRRPMLWGVSKKSFLGRILGVEERVAGGWAVHAWLQAKGGPQIWRVHEVGEMRQFLEMWEHLSGK